MLRNKIDPITLIGTPLLLIGIFILSITYELYVQVTEYPDPSNWNVLIFVFSVGVLCCVLSVCLFLKLEWARITMLIFLLVIGIVWTVYLVGNISEDRPFIANPVTIGTSILIYGVLLLFALILQNHFVLQHFRGELPDPREERADILDH